MGNNIELGRIYANGDGVAIDFEKAYYYWKGVSGGLSGDDFDLFIMLQMIYSNYDNDLQCIKDGSDKFSKTSSCIRPLGENNSDNGISLYDAQNRKKENILFGQIIAFIMKQYGWNRYTYRELLNAELLKSGYKEKSVQAISQILLGVNGMDAAGKWCSVNIFNAADQKQSKLKKPLIISDINVHPSLKSVAELFKNPKIDEVHQKIIDEENVQ